MDRMANKYSSGNRNNPSVIINTSTPADMNGFIVVGIFVVSIVVGIYIYWLFGVIVFFLLFGVFNKLEEKSQSERVEKYKMSLREIDFMQFAN